ncbi:CLUMA_CG013418, isoform A [Clunio marinus]|uniref:CLUMA_CG013418, isoform A n=1 Tax=Clunio marinus TaxID=568069 RepID=A0A1J1IIS9_9DIPT|nr:CLUMA_CG013418, isoform A [Clunio marinus]
MKVFKTLTLSMILGALGILHLSWAKRVISFTSVTCSGSNKSMMILECSVKPVAEEQNGLNIVMDFFKKIESFVLTYNFSIKIRKGFRSLVNGDKLDVCKFLNGTKTKSNVMNYVMDMVKHTFPERSLRPCPIIGRHDLVNITAGRPGSTATVFPESSYRVTMKYSSKEDDNIISILLYVVAKDIKD